MRRLRSLLRLAVLIRSDSTQAVQTLQVSIGSEILTDIEHLEPYGFTSRMKAGAEVLVAALKGNPGHAVAIVVGGRQFRLTDLAKGEVALYNDLGNVIHFMRDKIRVNAVTAIDVTSPATTINGPLHVTGDITTDADCVASGVSLVGHTHPGDSGGTTGVPN